MANIRFVGLDVHAQTIAVAVAEQGGEVRLLGTIPNSADAIRKLVKKLGPPEKLRACYEAGPTGYVLYWYLAQLGVRCDVIAPSLVPTKPGDRVKTDHRDAERLARALRAGDLTSVWVPDRAHEALRDLVRAREAAKADQLRARHRVTKFLLRQGRRPPGETKAWGSTFMKWIRSVHFEQPAQEAAFQDYLAEVDHGTARIRRLEDSLDEAIAAAPAAIRVVIDALQCLRGVRKLTAVSVVSELGRFSRFEKARQLMGYSGTVPSEHSSGASVYRGSITKTGNAHLRRVIGEAAWSYRYAPGISPALHKRQRGQPSAVREIAWKAQHRLSSRYRKLIARGKSAPKAITAVARELLGFMWAIGVLVERELEGRSLCAA